MALKIYFFFTQFFIFRQVIFGLNRLVCGSIRNKVTGPCSK